MTEQVFDLFLRKEQERSYLRVPFPVGPGARTLRLRYAYVRRAAREIAAGEQALEETAVIDLALETPEGRLCGASGSEHGGQVSKPGPRRDLAPAPDPGVWQAVLGLYWLPAEGCPVS